MNSIHLFRHHLLRDIVKLCCNELLHDDTAVMDLLPGQRTAVRDTVPGPSAESAVRYFMFP